MMHAVAAAMIVAGTGVGAANGDAAEIEITTRTAYPFSDVVLMNVTVTSATASESRPRGSGESTSSSFPLLLRIPAWCKSPLLTVAGKKVDASAPDESGFIRVERSWTTGDVINLTLPAEIVARKRLTFGNGLEDRKYNPAAPWSVRNNSSLSCHVSFSHARVCHLSSAERSLYRDRLSNIRVGENKGFSPCVRQQDQNTTGNLPFCEISRGSLTFALPMEANPQGEYGFALQCDAATMRFAASPLPDTPWDWPLDAPLTITAKARPFAWADAWRLPSAPVTAEEATGPEQEVTLVPYGNTKVLVRTLIESQPKCLPLASIKNGKERFRRLILARSS